MARARAPRPSANHKPMPSQIVNPTAEPFSAERPSVPVKRDDGNDVAVVDQADAATTDEVELWREVSTLLKRKERVDLNRAIKSLQCALSYCKESRKSSAEARHFLNNCMGQIVSVLLHTINLGEMDSSENERIKSCLKSSLELVSNDLADACKNDDICHTLPVLTDIFDEVTGYNERDRSTLVNRFQSTNGLHHLGLYLLNETHSTSPFPSLHSITTILTLARRSVYSSPKNCLAIARAVMICLCSLGEDHLTRLDDDCTDILTWVKDIYSKVTRHHDSKAAFEHFKLCQSFVLKLIKSSSAPLKLFGYAELENIVNKASEYRPLPRAYIVDGAGVEVVNGVYDIDPEKLTDFGGFKGKHDVKYIKRASFISEEEKDGDTSNDAAVTLSYYFGVGQWKISRVTWGKEECLYSNERQRGFLFNRPCETGWRAETNGVSPAPTTKPMGILPSDATLEEDVVEWIFDNNLIEAVVSDASHTEDDFRFEVEKTTKTMMNLTNEILNLVVENITAQSEEICDSLVDIKRACDLFDSVATSSVSAEANRTLERIIGYDFITRMIMTMMKLTNETLNLLVENITALSEESCESLVDRACDLFDSVTTLFMSAKANRMLECMGLRDDFITLSAKFHDLRKQTRKARHKSCSDFENLHDDEFGGLPEEQELLSEQDIRQIIDSAATITSESERDNSDMAILRSQLYAQTRSFQFTKFGEDIPDLLKAECGPKSHSATMKSSKVQQEEVRSCMNEMVYKVFVDNKSDLSNSNHCTSLPPPLFAEYDVVLPVTSKGLLLNIGESYGAVKFLGYRQLNGDKGPAELANLVRASGDLIIAVNGKSTVGKTFTEVIGMLKENITYAYIRFLSSNGKGVEDAELSSCGNRGRFLYDAVSMRCKEDRRRILAVRTLALEPYSDPSTELENKGQSVLTRNESTRCLAYDLLDVDLGYSSDEGDEECAYFFDGVDATFTRMSKPNALITDQQTENELEVIESIGCDKELCHVKKSDFSQLGKPLQLQLALAMTNQEPDLDLHGDFVTGANALVPEENNGKKDTRKRSVHMI